jgi:hypothetical protein
LYENHYTGEWDTCAEEQPVVAQFEQQSPTFGKAMSQEGNFQDFFVVLNYDFIFLFTNFQELIADLYKLRPSPLVAKAKSYTASSLPKGVVQFSNENVMVLL